MVTLGGNDPFIFNKIERNETLFCARYMQFYRNYMIDNDLPLVSEKYLVGVLYIEVKSSKQRIGSSG